MTLLPRLCALLLACLLPVEVTALTLAELEGRWRGEGTLTLEDEPEQRLRCQIRFQSMTGERSFFTGRCATAQAARSFTYMLIPTGPTTILAENRMEQSEDLPQSMTGVLDGDSLRFGAEGAPLFALQLVDGGLEFRIESDGPDGFARGRARLGRTDEGGSAP